MTRRQRIEDLTAFAVPGQPALSPDGGHVVYVVTTSDTEADRNVTALWRVPTSGGEPRQLTRGKADSAPAWSPDGARVAFLRAQDGPAQVWVLPVDGGEPEQLTTLPLGAGAPRWSPDGRSIAFAAAVDLVAVAGEDDEARTKRAGAPIVAERLDYQSDGAGLLRTMRSHLHVVDVAAKDCRQVTEGDWHAGEPAWSPDSTMLAFGAATLPESKIAPPSPVHVVDVTSPAARPRLVGLAEGSAGALTWTRDGAALLVVGRPDQRVGLDQLLRVPVAGGDVVDLAAPLDRNVMQGGTAYPGAWPQLAGDGDAVLFCVRDRGCSHVYSVPVAGGTPSPVVTGAGRLVSGMSVAGRTAAVVLGTPTSLGEIAVVDLASGAETVLTDHGADHADVELFVPQEREFTISDGTVVHGWLIRDPAVRGAGPLLLDVHGGPHNAWHGAAEGEHLYRQELAARGWTVLLLNPRGSDGYGDAFMTAALGGWGTADEQDFLEPIDQLVAEGVADPDRLAVAGYSYGGFMTCYLTSRDSRFAAAVTGGVVADLQSMIGTSDAGHYLGDLELGAMPWADRERYALSSPMALIDKVRTPTLIIQGADDVRCPVGQAQQWHMALRERSVPTRLVLYPGGSHLFIFNGPPSHRLDFNRRVLEWVERYAGHSTGPRPARIDGEHWQRRLSALAGRYRIPGATLGILRMDPGGEDELAEAAYGVLNKATGVPVTTDSLFQVGSITKVWTTTLVMQLVDEGLLDLDAPVAEVLPELRLADPEATKKVTVRHLVTHTSGIDGDVFTDTGRGDDAVEKYVALLAGAAQNHPLGATFSYCNSGFALAGRVIEKLTGMSWDQAVRERLCTPLGLTHTVTLPEDALRHRAALGHVATAGAEPEPAPVWGLPRSVGPAGLITSTVADVLSFARLHLTGGVAGDGTRLLSAAGATAMTRKHADLPDTHALGDSWGLGWIRFDWQGHELIGHDGNTVGQSAFLRLLPEQGLAVTLLTNGGDAADLYDALYSEIFAEVAGVELPARLGPPAEPVTVDVQRHVGTYERAGARLEVFVGDDGPMLRVTGTGPLAEIVPEPPQEYGLVAVEESLFVFREPEGHHWVPAKFYELPTGERYLHVGGRATPKVG